MQLVEEQPCNFRGWIYRQIRIEVEKEKDILLIDYRKVKQITLFDKE